MRFFNCKNKINVKKNVDEEFKKTKFFEEEHDNGFRIMVVGETGIGKTKKIDDFLLKINQFKSWKKWCKWQIKRYDFTSKIFDDRNDVIYFLQEYGDYKKHIFLGEILKRTNISELELKKFF